MKSWLHPVVFAPTSVDGSSDRPLARSRVRSRAHKIIRSTVVALALLTSCLPASAQAPVSGTADRKSATATRVPNGSIRVDGRLDDEAWQKAAPITDFIQKEPTEGAAPTDAMDVRLVYDEDVLYVGARMASTDGRIQAPLGRRDSTDQAEHILISFDTFLDRRTAVVFGVTAGGVRIDRYHSSDNEDSFDSGYDPVWRAGTDRKSVV